MMLQAMRGDQKDESYVLRIVMRKTGGAWCAMMYAAAPALTRWPEGSLLCEDYRLQTHFGLSR